MRTVVTGVHCLQMKTYSTRNWNGKGYFLIKNAIRYPNINFIGIEKYYSVLIKVINRPETLDLPNLKIIPIDAKKNSKRKQKMQ